MNFAQDPYALTILLILMALLIGIALGRLLGLNGIRRFYTNLANLALDTADKFTKLVETAPNEEVKQVLLRQSKEWREMAEEYSSKANEAKFI